MREADKLTTFKCRMSRKSGSLNLLEPSGSHLACNGTALHLPLPLPLSLSLPLSLPLPLPLRLSVLFIIIYFDISFYV